MTCLVNEKGTFHYKRAFYILFKKLEYVWGWGGGNMPLACPHSSYARKWKFSSISFVSAVMKVTSFD